MCFSKCLSKSMFGYAEFASYVRRTLSAFGEIRRADKLTSRCWSSTFRGLNRCPGKHSVIIRNRRLVKSLLAWNDRLSWREHLSSSMSLNEIWEGAAGSPFHPTVPKERQFLVAFSLLLVGKSKY